MATRAKTGGRARGTPNKISGELKAMILGALDECGGQAYFIQQAKENPVAFMTLIGKILPSELSANVAINDMDKATRDEIIRRIEIVGV